MLSNGLYVITILFLVVLVAEWLGQKKYFRYLGSVLLVIILAAILANLRIIPSSNDEAGVYNGVFTYIAPLAIFFLLLDVKLKELRSAGLAMILLFLAGSLCSVVGVLASWAFIKPQHHDIWKAYAVAGMYTGTYTGGSANLNAVALQYGVSKNGTLFAAINAADNIITTLWMIITIFLPPLLQRWMPRGKRVGDDNRSTEEPLDTGTIREEVSVAGISLLLALGAGSLLLSKMVTIWFPQVPDILVLTTLALVFAQLPFVHRLKGGKILGYFMVLLFLAVVGAYCDLHALLSNGEMALTLLLWVTSIVFIHGILLFTLGGIFRQDWDIIAVASNANIGGATSAPVLATSLGRTDLNLPGILVGSLGTAIGTYLGIFIAEMLK